MPRAAPVPQFVPNASPIEVSELLFALCRRQGDPFSVVAVEIDGANLPVHERVILAALRRTDVLVRWGSSPRYTVFCPATPAEGAKELVARIAASGLGARFRCGVACFPLDSLVLDELIDAAFQHLRPDGAYSLGEGGQGGSRKDRGDEDGKDRNDGKHGGDGSDEDERDGTALEELEARELPRLLRRPLRSRLERTHDQRAAAVVKRAFDIALCLFTAPLWLPVLVAVAAAIKLSEPAAPVLFFQERTGRGGRRFRMVKFRTMVPDAEAVKAELAHLNQLQPPDFKIPADPRVTRLGHLLRRTSLDELPQLWNVLRGEMSWVGPRPTSFGAETYEVWQTARLDVVPGITGLWQVEGRARTEFSERLRLDMDYIDRRSLLLDVAILVRTVREVFRPRGGC